MVDARGTASGLHGDFSSKAYVHKLESCEMQLERLKHDEEMLFAREQRLLFALDAGSAGVWDWNLSTGETWFSDVWMTMLGYQPGELLGNVSTWEKLIHPEDKPHAQRLVEAHLRGETSHYECEQRLRCKDGSWGWVLARGKVAERNADAEPMRFVGTHVDIRSRKEAEFQIAYMARHDSLTDLPNRALFQERLNAQLLDAARHDHVSAVLCLDLDRFKAVNDTFGHLAGDAVLRELSARMKRLLRATDTLARLGGDEFGILIADASDRAGLEALAGRLVESAKQPVKFGEFQAEVGLSVGIAFTPEHGTDAETVFRRADMALYYTKALGRNGWRLFDEVMDRKAIEAGKLERHLRQAIARDEMCMHYQPLVDSVTNELIGFEALMRWQHPERGLVAPNDFIPLAEESGMIFQLGEWALRRACRDAALWSPHLRVAVNLSPNQFRQPDLPERVLSILRDTGLEAARLELEITENVIIDNIANALSILRRLKSFGIAIVIDDFGTGYSSLATLQAFPFDKIKIDRSFVGQIEVNPQAAVITRAVVGLGRSLGMRVIAEGVETEAQLRFLREEGCPEIQGYLVSRAMPIEHFANETQADHALMAPGLSKRGSIVQRL